jgi:hypothetical protein
MKKNKMQCCQFLIGMFCLFLIGFTFSSCETEKDFAKHNKIIVKKFSMKDVNLRLDFKLNEALNYLKRLQAKSLQQNCNAKLVYDEKSGLYYDDEKGLYVLKDGKESYTFPIIESDTTEKLKNITFNKNSSNEFDIYIVKYDFTKEDLNNYTKEALASREVKYQALLKNGVEYPVEVQWMVCIYVQAYVQVFPIDQGELTGNNGNDWTWVTVSSTCYSGVDSNGGPSGPTDSTGANGNETGGSGSNGTTTNSDNQDNTIITVAAIDSYSTNTKIDDATNIADLKKITKKSILGVKTKVKQYMDDLKSRLAFTGGQPTIIEDGAMFNEEQTPALEPNTRQPTKTSWYNYPSSYYIVVHMHQNLYYDVTQSPPQLKLTNPIPSDDDVRNFLGMYDYQQNNNPRATLITVTLAGTFAIRYNDTQKATNAYNILRDDKVEREKYTLTYDNAIMDLYNQVPMDKELMKTKFATFINTYQINEENMGLSLYEAVSDTQGNITNWIKL